MSREANVAAFGGQAAGRDITNYFARPCSGPESCPYERDEADAQINFERKTGIACSRGAREAIQHLLDTGVFQYKQLALAWRQHALWWDQDAKQLRADVSRLDVAYGFFLLAAGIGALLVLTIWIIFGRDSGPSGATQNQLFGAGAALVLAAPMAERYLIRPSRIASRVKPLLDELYRGDSAKP